MNRPVMRGKVDSWRRIGGTVHVALVMQGDGHLAEGVLEEGLVYDLHLAVCALAAYGVAPQRPPSYDHTVPRGQFEAWAANELSQLKRRIMDLEKQDE